MSWKDAINYGKAMLAQQGITPNTDHSADENLPLGARIGGLISLQQTPFIRANTNGAIVDIPDQLTNQICSIGRVRFDADGQLLRYYFWRGDEDDEAEVYVQLYQDQVGTISEVMYCARLTRFIPQSSEQQAAYMGSNGAGLGEPSYTIYKQQLSELGYSADELDNIFGDEDQLIYQRDVGNEAQQFIAPFKGTEIRIDDSNGEQGLRQQIFYMPYVRTLRDQQTKEYLFISTDIVESKNGDPSKRAIHVNFMLGLALDLERMTVQ